MSIRSKKRYTKVEKYDPFFEREKEKYESPVASREFILEFLQSSKTLLSRKELMEIFAGENEDKQEALRRRLIAMCRDGQLMQNRKGLYVLPEEAELVKGRVVIKKDGSGVIVPEDGGKDIILNYYQTATLFPNDKVLVSISEEQAKKRFGKIVEILQRTIKQVAGYYHEENGVAFVIPTSKVIKQEILLGKEEVGVAKEGQLVVADIVSYPTKHHGAIGKIVDIISDKRGKKTEIDLAIRSYGLPYQWSEEVDNELKEILQVNRQEMQGWQQNSVDKNTIDKNTAGKNHTKKSTVDKSTAEKNTIKKNLTEKLTNSKKHQREDLRNLTFVTIDGEDARDFDDAVYCKKRLKNKGWILYVAIADVANYVTSDSVLDQEAFNRGNSVYFPQRVVHMLPEELSCDLCSLKPDVDRLVLVCEMQFNETGEIVKYKFMEAIIKSQARLTYNQVFNILENTQHKHTNQENKKHKENASNENKADEKKTDENPEKSNAENLSLEVMALLHELKDLYKILKGQRSLRGALEFNRTETKIIFADHTSQECIEKIIPYTTNYVNGIIEECMLSANVCASQFLLKHKMPTLFRVHQGPKPEKLMTVRNFLKNLGLNLSGGAKPTTLDYAKILSKIQGRNDELLLQTLLLRSLSQAVYSPNNIGHFGLAYDSYVHFTSPIRRYPDLLVHRAIKHILQKNKAKSFIYNHEAMQRYGEHCSMTERRADNATNEVVDWYKCQFMQNKIGYVSEGVITSVTDFGLFIELKDFYVEGLLHVTALPNDYYQFIHEEYLLRGKFGGSEYCLGDTIIVQVSRVDMDERHIEFTLPRPKTNPKTKQKSKSKAKTKAKANLRTKQKPTKKTKEKTITITKSKPKTKIKPKSKSKSKTKTKSKPDVKIDANAKPSAKVKAKEKPQAKIQDK